eukprot:gb/GEZN01015697.1/.p1 GENE.gb/GEZN01015697.1/~~gb/GEZN01015697.1/.p1  ORF type:complete len:256 (-),score=50.64 gb/GEZN01015697.1/:115-846(-)
MERSEEDDPAQVALLPPNTRPRLFRASSLLSNLSEVKEAQVYHGKSHWRSKLLEILHDHNFQLMLMVLLVLDVFMLMGEIFLDSEFACNPRTCDGLCKDEPGAVEFLHQLFFVLSVLIMSIFALELLLLWVAIGTRKFISNKLYLLDVLVVFLALVLEVWGHHKLEHDAGHQTEHEETVNTALASEISVLLVVSRTWRLVRIGHGIFDVTREVEEAEMVQPLAEEIKALQAEVASLKEKLINN